MDFLTQEMMSSLESVSTLSSFFRIGSTIALYLFMYFTAKSRGKKLEVKWFILGFFFPTITFIVFLCKNSSNNQENLKVCAACGEKFPEIFQVCGKCLAPLPEINRGARKKEKIIAKASLIIFIVLFLVDLVVGGYMLVKTFIDTFNGVVDSYGYTARIAVADESEKKVYYDRNGNSYENSDDVLLYDRDGNTYSFVSDEEQYEFYYKSSDGAIYDSYNSYVDKEGYFYYYTGSEFIYPEYRDIYDEDEGDTEVYTADFGDYYDSEGYLYYYVAAKYEDENYVYKYYDHKIYDKNSNFYFYADEASWNENGELITENNDPTAAEVS